MPGRSIERGSRAWFKATLLASAVSVWVAGPSGWRGGGVAWGWLEPTSTTSPVEAPAESEAEAEQRRAAERAAAEAKARAEAAATPFPTSSMSIDYLERHYSSTNKELRPGLPPIDEIRSLEVNLSIKTTEDGHTVLGAPKLGEPVTTIPIRSLEQVDPKRIMQWDAIEEVSRRVVAHLTEGPAGLMAVQVGPSANDVTLSTSDLIPADNRNGERTTLDLKIDVGVVSKVKAVPVTRPSVQMTFGSRNWLEEKVERDSPVKGSQSSGAGFAVGQLTPAAASGASTEPSGPTTAPSAELTKEEQDRLARQSLLRRRALEDFVYRVNRYPGRRIDLAVTPGTSVVPAGTAGGGWDEGNVDLNYLLTETNPLTLYAQVSNTGTDATNVWRERFGITHTQLTGVDDVLNISYDTASFDGSSQAISGSYERPLLSPTFGGRYLEGWDRLRGRIYFSYSDYTASDVGQNRDNFEGSTTSGGGELIFNVYQRGQLFVDLLGGGRYDYSRVVTTGQGTGETNIISPYGAVRLDRTTELDSLEASVTVTYSSLDADEATLSNNLLGRPNVDGDAVSVVGRVSYSFYLEPVLLPDQFAEGKGTMANELYVEGRGQTGFDYRLLPQDEATLGGLYSVRGYPVSVVAGDNMVFGTVEYRWHIPRSLGINPNPPKLLGVPFRVSPQQVYGRPDWDLVFKAFVDAGQVTTNNKLAGEGDSTLVGTGLGLELQLRQNVAVQGYWGIALKDLQDASTKQTTVTAGSSQFWLVVTLLLN